VLYRKYLSNRVRSAVGIARQLGQLVRGSPQVALRVVPIVLYAQIAVISQVYRTSKFLDMVACCVASPD
jgi:hypothetical protein